MSGSLEYKSLSVPVLLFCTGGGEVGLVRLEEQLLLSGPGRSRYLSPGETACFFFPDKSIGI